MSKVIDTKSDISDEDLARYWMRVKSGLQREGIECAWANKRVAHPQPTGILREGAKGEAVESGRTERELMAFAPRCVNAVLCATVALLLYSNFCTKRNTRSLCHV